ncbi:MAG: DJ-1/PfpI family protein [Crinalium sp.]
MSQNNSTSTKRVVILVEKMVEDSEFQVPHQALKQAGMEVVVLGSRMNEQYPGKQGKVSIKPDATTTEARPEYFDAVIIPGPVTVALLAEIEVDLAQYEQRVAQMYHSLIGAQPAQAAKPTSAAAMG